MWNPFRRREDLDAAFAELDEGFDVEMAKPAPTFVEVERRKSDEFQDELRGQAIRLEGQIEALRSELAGVMKVLKAEVLRARELDTDGSYSPEADNLGSHAVAIETKRQRGDKHFIRPAKDAAQAREAAE
ncbi:hypothetical protein [Mesorhizobium sp. WSM2239]|uniref:Uncharacterized protein n=2 Tax=unclassified Mesorhizobium TaxID=325217 RepID=A0AAU8D2R4_9HYPH